MDDITQQKVEIIEANEKQSSELKLISWFNEKIEPPRHLNLLLNQEKWNELKQDCDRLRSRLSQEIHWNRYESTIKQQPLVDHHFETVHFQLNHNLEQLFSVYNRVWLQLVPQFLLGHTDHNHNLHSKQQSQLGTIRQIVQLIVQQSTRKGSNIRTQNRITIEMLTIIFLLDQAKTRRLFRHNPRLFQEQSTILNLNSSQLVFDYYLLHCFLLSSSSAGGSSCSSSGSSTGANSSGVSSSFALRTELKQRLNYVLFHRECEPEFFFNKFPMTIERLCDDLVNGIRLAKLAEILFQIRGLVEKLRFPANRLSERESNIRTIFDSILTQKLRYYFVNDRDQFPGNFPKSIALGVRQSTIELLERLIEIDRKQLLEQHYRPHLRLIQHLQQTVRNRQQSFKIRQKYLQLRRCTIYVQRSFRLKLLTVHTRAWFVQLRRSAQIIQKRYRLQKNLRLFRKFVHDEIARRKQAAIVIQSRWKGFKIRQEIAALYPWLTEMVLRMRTEAGGPIRTSTLCLGTKVNQTLNRLHKSYQTQKQQPLLKVAINRRLLDDISQLSRGVYHSREISDSILYQQQWIFEYLSSILVRLNRSEQHKTLAYNLQSIILGLLNRMKQKTTSLNINSCQLERQMAAPPLSLSKLSISTLIGAMLHLMNNCLHYVPLLRQSISILSRLVDIRDCSQTAEQLLLADRRWQRLIERIRLRYQISDSVNPTSHTQLGAATASFSAPPTPQPLWPKTPDQKSRVKNLAILAIGQSPSILQTPGGVGSAANCLLTNWNLELKHEFIQLIERLI